MTPIPGVDYAFSRPDPAALYAAGYRYAIRYGGPGGTGKHLTTTEAAALTDAGLWIVANAEGTTNGLLGGRAIGQQWAMQAALDFSACGMPTAIRPIYLSVDFDCQSGQWNSVLNGLIGAANSIGLQQVGVYGPYDVLTWAHAVGIRWLWQAHAPAWSHGRNANRHPNALIRQTGPSMFGGQAYDRNEAYTDDYGQWQPGKEPPTMALTTNETNALTDCLNILTALANGVDNATVHDHDGTISLIPFYTRIASLIANPNITDEQITTLANTLGDKLGATLLAAVANADADELARRLQS